MKESPATDPKGGISKVKLALGAASLFLFIVGLKRTFSMEDAGPGARLADPGEDGPEPEEKRLPRA